MNLFLELLPTFLIFFGASFLFNIMKDFMEMSFNGSSDIIPVEVVNIHDLGRK